MKNYYKILDVQKDASQDQIKKAFRKLAQKYHPDKNPEDEVAGSKFKEINEAYQTLSNENSRKEYDFISSGGRSHGIPGDFFGGFGDLFGDLFGGGGRRPQPAQNQDPAIRITTTVSELMSGDAKRTFKIVDEIECGSCMGVGGKSRERCRSCNGTGQTVKRMRHGTITFQTASPCGICHGSGHTIQDVCRECLGNGFTRKEELFDIFLTCKRR